MENIESQLLAENFANLFTFFSYLGYFDLPVIASKERMAIAKSLFFFLQTIIVLH